MADGKRDKPFSAPFPLRAIGDKRLSGLDLRTLGAIAAHDRMSDWRGKGRGCDASHKTLAAKIGTDETNLSKSIGKLVSLDYVVASRPSGDKRTHVYRVPARLYDHAESLSFHQPSVSKELGQTTNYPEPKVVGDFTNDIVEMVGEGLSESGENPPNSPRNIFRINGEKYSSEEARPETRSLSRIEFDDNDGAQMASFERQWKASPESFTRSELERWSERFEEIQEFHAPGSTENGWARRLASEIADFPIALGTAPNGESVKENDDGL